MSDAKMNKHSRSKNPLFHPRRSVFLVEEGDRLAPAFGSSELLPVVTTEADSGEVLMHAHMNEQALRELSRRIPQLLLPFDSPAGACRRSIEIHGRRKNLRPLQGVR